MKVHDLTIYDEALGWITDGRKTLDIRVGYHKIKTVAVGDELVLSSLGRWAKVRVTAIRRYSSFAQMVRHEDTEKIAPEMTSEQLVLELQHLLGKNEHLGVYVFEIELIGARGQ